MHLTFDVKMAVLYTKKGVLVSGVIWPIQVSEQIISKNIVQWIGGKLFEAHVDRLDKGG